MCGIVGWINLKQNLTEQRPVIEKMSETLFYRGPMNPATILVKTNTLSPAPSNPMPTPAGSI